MSTQTPLHNRYRWLICGLLFFATTINYVDRQILSLIKPILDQELGWTNEQFGQVNAAFQFTYGFGLIGFGWLVDRFGSKIGYSISIVSWSLCAMGHGLATNVMGFFVARMSLGLSEGGNFPSAIKSTSQWFPQHERALATSLFNSGTNVGAILAPAIVPWIALTWGWRYAFYLAGAAGFVWLFFWLLLYNTPAKTALLSQEEKDYIEKGSIKADDAEGLSADWLALFKKRETWAFIVGKFATDPVWWFFLIWLPDYFAKTRNLNIKDSQLHLISIYAIITILSIVGGWVPGLLVKRGWSVTRARKTSMIIFALAVLPILAVTSVGNWTAVLLIALAGGAHQAWSANLFTTVSDVFPKYAVASVIGIGGMAGATGGMLFPIYSGKLLDRFSAAGNITGGYSILFSVCAFAYIVAFAIHHLLVPKFEPTTVVTKNRNT